MQLINKFEFYKDQSDTSNPKEFSFLFDSLPDSIPELCEIVHGVISHRDSSELYGLELTEKRKMEGETRYVDLILKLIYDQEKAPLTKKREPIKRFAGTCRDFALLLCSILRYKGIPARIRCGYANYFTAGRYEDHWVCEYFNSAEHRWVLVDAEVDELYKKYFKMTLDVYDIPRDKFLVGGQAWIECRAGRLDPNIFGVASINIQGIGFVRGNVIRDIASLNKIELLPWDEWGISEKEFDNLSNEEISIVNEIADKSIPEVDDLDEMIRLYQEDGIKIPEFITSWTTYGGIQKVKLRS